MINKLFLVLCFCLLSSCGLGDNKYSSLETCLNSAVEDYEGSIRNARSLADKQIAKYSGAQRYAEVIEKCNSVYGLDDEKSARLLLSSIKKVEAIVTD